MSIVEYEPVKLDIIENLENTERLNLDTWEIEKVKAYKGRSWLVRLLQRLGLYRKD
jgi:hypothetical protein